MSLYFRERQLYKNKTHILKRHIKENGGSIKLQPNHNIKISYKMKISLTNINYVQLYINSFV